MCYGNFITNLFFNAYVIEKKKRAEKRLKYEENSEKLAEKIFLLQVKKTVEREIHKKQE